MNRYNVTVEREVIVFADSPGEAETKALSYLASVSNEQPATRPVKVVDPFDDASAPSLWLRVWCWLRRKRIPQARLVSG